MSPGLAAIIRHHFERGRVAQNAVWFYTRPVNLIVLISGDFARRSCKAKNKCFQNEIYFQKTKGNAKSFPQLKCRNAVVFLLLFFSFLNASDICVEEVGTRFRSVTFLSLESLCCVRACCVHWPCAPHCVLCCRRCVRSALSFPRCHSAPWPPPLQR